MRLEWHQAILTATGFPRPMENPLVPSGIRGTEGCFTTVGCSIFTEIFEVTPRWFPRLLELYAGRPRPFPQTRFSLTSRNSWLRLFLNPPSLVLACSSSCQNEREQRKLRIIFAHVKEITRISFLHLTKRIFKVNKIASNNSMRNACTRSLQRMRVSKHLC